MVNYNKQVREPFTEKTKLQVEKLIREPFTESTPTKEETFSIPQKKDTATVVCPSDLNVRQSADILSRVVATLRSGDTVVLGHIQGDWGHIYTSSGIEGYSLSAYIVPTPVE